MSRRTAARIGWVAAVIAAAGVGALAGRATFTPPPVADEALPTALFTAVEASVGSSVALPVTAQWVTHPLAAGSTSGMVTSLGLDGVGLVSAGDVPLAVDQRPVVVAQGATPAFRDLAQGARGDDVVQLQAFLVEAGFLRGEPSGVFGASTTAAVREWQRSLGVQRTGFVAAGDLLFVEELPARLVLGDDVVVGSLVSPGQQLLAAVERAPRFTATVSAGMQAAVVPPTGATVLVGAPDGSAWEATVTGSERDEFGGTTLFLAGADGGAVCGRACDLIEFTGRDIVLNGHSVLTPEVTGPGLPHAAVGTAADGTRFVVLEDGTRVTVTVLAVDASRKIVDGVSVGDAVHLFATTDADGP